MLIEGPSPRRAASPDVPPFSHPGRAPWLRLPSRHACPPSRRAPSRSTPPRARASHRRRRWRTAAQRSADRRCRCSHGPRRRCHPAGSPRPPRPGDVNHTRRERHPVLEPAHGECGAAIENRDDAAVLTRPMLLHDRRGKVLRQVAEDTYRAEERDRWSAGPQLRRSLC
jgi:hypothetical protein